MSPIFKPYKLRINQTLCQLSPDSVDVLMDLIWSALNSAIEQQSASNQIDFLRNNSVETRHQRLVN